MAASRDVPRMGNVQPPPQPWLSTFNCVSDWQSGVYRRKHRITSYFKAPGVITARSLLVLIQHRTEAASFEDSNFNYKYCMLEGVAKKASIMHASSAQVILDMGENAGSRDPESYFLVSDTTIVSVASLFFGPFRFEHRTGWIFPALVGVIWVDSWIQKGFAFGLRVRSAIGESGSAAWAKVRRFWREATASSD